MSFGFTATDPLLDWINEANAQFVEAYDWPWLKKEVSGVLSIGADVLSTIPPASVVPDAMSIIVTSGSNAVSVPLDYLPASEYRTTCIGSTMGTPLYWTKISDTDYRITPPSDTAYGYTISYTDIAETFTSDANTPQLPSRYHYALVRGAAAIGLDSDNQEERADRQQERFQEIIDRAMAKYRSEQQGRFSKIRNAAGY
jgi:hypothetical protein